MKTTPDVYADALRAVKRRTTIAHAQRWQPPSVWQAVKDVLLLLAAVAVLGFVLGWSTHARAQQHHAFADGAGDAQSPHFVVKSAGAVGTLPLQSTDVQVYVAGMLADVQVTQHYRNTGDVPLEAEYVFPGSTRAVVYAMRMTVGNRQIDAEIKEKREAKQIYDKAKQAGKTASLLEQERSNIFQMRVANILPGDDVVVVMHYTELLVPQQGAYGFVFPTVVGPRYMGSSKGVSGTGASTVAESKIDSVLQALEGMVYADQSGGAARSVAGFALEMEIDSPIAIQRIASDTHTLRVQHAAGSSHATLELLPEEGSNGSELANRDVVIQYQLAGDAVESGVMLYQGDGSAGDKENFFLAMLEPPQRVASSQISPREYVFVMDVSGSMHGFPLDTAKTMLRELVGQLRPSDQFNVLLFAGSNRFLSPQPVPATKANIDKAMQVIDSTQSRGSTELMPALQSVYALPKNNDVSRTVVVVTDGYVTVEREAFQIIRQNLSKANVFAFGIGSSVNRALIEGIARAGMGEPFVITQPSDAKAQAQRFRQMIDSPVLTDVQVRFDGLDVYDVVPQVLPDVLAQRPVVVFGKWRGTPEGMAVIEGQSASGAYSHAAPVNSAVSRHAKALRYLWARHRIASLTDQESLTGEAHLQKTITQLGLDYSLLTQYTSFVAVDKVVCNVQKDGVKVKQAVVKQAVPLPEGVNMAAEISAPSSTHVPSTPEPESWAAAMVVLSMLGMLARRERKAKRRAHRYT